jgi:hypothetical protein
MLMSLGYFYCLCELIFLPSCEAGNLRLVCIPEYLRLGFCSEKRVTDPDRVLKVLELA